MEDKNHIQKTEKQSPERSKRSILATIQAILSIPGMLIKLGIIALAVVIVFIWFFSGQGKVRTRQIDITSIATLEKIVKVNKLSTYTAVYNGVTAVRNKENYEKIDYYVSYEAKVNLGINFDDIAVQVDKESQKIIFKMPEIHTTEVNVDISTLDFIFYNNQANTVSITQEAYAICIEDARAECAKIPDISVLAKQNAINAVQALVKPIVEQSKLEYTLVFE